MTQERRLPPNASFLSASMRDLGYSFETAIADLIDNSISASANNIEIFCVSNTESPYLAIIDNGNGMNREEMVDAMRHGSSNPKEERANDDLGRFGLGLKTASFSQCKCLTVVSSRKGQRCSAEWNLDVIDEKNDWLLSIPNKDEISTLPLIERLNETGTLVLWRNLDRLFEGKSGLKRQEIVNEKIDVLEKHLSLVFHRFLSGEMRRREKLTISINGHNVESFDPFCRKNSATQILPDETVRINGRVVRIQPFILPHHSKLSAKEHYFYQERSNFMSNQGAYIYRNGRLMAWGDWFRLIPKTEATKLARIQIDFPNSLDKVWEIDIKKSRAAPPLQVRERLRQIISRIINRSVTVHQGRGKKLFSKVKKPVWERYRDQKTIRYILNGEHPLVQSLADNIGNDKINHLHVLLDAISSSLPIDMIYSDFSTHEKEMQQPPINEDVAMDRLGKLRDALLGDREIDVESFRDVVRSTRLFDAHTKMVEQFIQKEFR